MLQKLTQGRNVMKLIGITTTAVFTLALGITSHAQTTTQTKTEVKVKDGADVNIVGCIETNADGKFMLTHAADKKGALPDYLLVTDDNNLSKHLGHRVDVSGIATDRGDGKLEIKREAKNKVEGADDQKTKSKSELEGDLGNLHYLKVNSVKMLAAACR